MEKVTLTTFEEMENEVAKLLETADKVGASTWQARVKQQTPHCKFGEEGICCRICSMGPCRITPKAPRGICGCDAHGIAGLLAAVRYLQTTGLDAIRETELDLMWAFYRQVSAIPGVTVYGDFSQRMRCPIVALNVRDYDSGEVSDALSSQYGIATRPGAHCAPLMHRALGKVEQGAVRFSFSHYNTQEEIKTAISALRELAQEE